MLIMWLGMGYLCHAQQNTIDLSGKLTDKEDGSEIVGATVLFINVKDSARSKVAATNEMGVFQVKGMEQAFYRLKITSLGYKPFTKIMRVAVSGDMGTIPLTPDTKVLDNIEIKGEVVAVEQIGDTTQYNAQAYKTNPDASAKDLVSKMPGIVVDSEGVKANGESIEQVLVDGKRFFGQDPLLSLNTIPAEIVDKVQVYDEESEQARLTGFDDGNTTKTMNVVTKKDKRNGEFGKFYAGYGEDDYYKAGAQVNVFKGDRRITFIGFSNNINQQNFGNEDIAGIGSGQRGGFRGSRGGNLMSGTQNGITKTNSIGLNFNNIYDDRLSIEGSYFFNNTSNSNDQVSGRETFLEGGSQFYDESQESNTDNWNHRLDMRVNYDIDDNNKIILTPRFSYQHNEGEDYTIGATRDEEGNILSQTENNYFSNTSAYNFQNNLTFQHKFEKIGRTISIDINTTLRPSERNNLYRDHQADSLIEYQTDEGNYTLGSTVTYTEPVGGYSQFSVFYGYNYNNRDSDKQTYLLDESGNQREFSPPLSNKFESEYTTHAPGISFATRKLGRFFDARLSYQQASLNNDQTYPLEAETDKSFNSILPSLMGRLELSESSDIFFRYSTSTDVPSVNQLQEVIDNSNPLFITIGNASLKQSYSHSLMMRVAKRNLDKNRSLSNFIRVEATSNYISNSTTVLRSDTLLANGVMVQRGGQISRPINIDGYWNVSNNTTYSFLMSALKTNMNTTLGLNYSRQPGITNGLENMANTYSGSFRVNFASNISENVDFNMHYQISANKVDNSIQSSSDSEYMNQTAGGDINLIVGKGYVFRSELTFQKYNGVSNAYDTHYTLWNMSVAKKFLKNDQAEVELSVFDLLGQNQSVSQNITGNYLQETRTEVIQRYFMLTLTYNLRNFHS